MAAVFRACLLVLLGDVGHHYGLVHHDGGVQLLCGIGLHDLFVIEIRFVWRRMGRNGGSF